MSDPITITFDSPITMFMAVVLLVASAYLVSIIFEIVASVVTIMAGLFMSAVGLALYVFFWFMQLPLNVYYAIKNFSWRTAIPQNYTPPVFDNDDTEQYAWFPTASACETHDCASFEGYTTLEGAMFMVPDSYAHDWERLPVSDVEDSTVINAEVYRHG